MPKKNKMKSSKKKIKTVEEKTVEPSPELIKSDEVSSTTDTTDVIQDLIVTPNKASTCEEELHKSHLAGIKTMSGRVDEHIKRIESLQKELTVLNIKQLSLLDECVNFFHELQSFKAQTEREAQIVFETFCVVKEKVKIVFEQILPPQLDALERDLKLLKFDQK